MKRRFAAIALAATLAPSQLAAQPADDAAPVRPAPAQPTPDAAPVRPAPAQPTPDAAPAQPADGAAPAPAQPTPDDAAPAQPAVTPPALLEPAAPDYPARALEDRVHAVAVLAIEIAEDGRVSSATVESLTVVPEGGAPRPGDGRYDFGPAAIEAARKMLFSPATYDGKPFSVQVSFTFRFALPDKPPEADTAGTEPARPSVVNYSGVLLERGTRSTVAGAIVTVYRGEGDALEGFEATTAADGSFEFYDLPEGTWSVRIERAGYIPVETDETFATDERVEGSYWIEKGTYSPYDLTVEIERPRKEVNRRSLSAAEISKVPGTLSDDPVQAVENLPGVARSGPLGGEIIVRGSGPQDTGVLIDGIAVPLIYHFGGLKSVVPSHVIGGIDFYPGNYSVAYGGAMGGILDLQLKRITPDRVHGSADVSVLDTSLYLEVPLGDDAAIGFAGRRSYIDFVLDAAIPDDADIALTSAPRYYDYQVIGNWRPRPAHDLRWLGMGSDDLFELLFDDPADAVGPGVAASGDLSARTSFQRAILDYRYTPSETFSNQLRLSAGRDQVRFAVLGIFELSANVESMQLRDTASFKLGDALTLDVGLDSTLSYTEGVARAPRITGSGMETEADLDDIITVEIAGDAVVDAAPFVEARLTLGALSLVPGLRLDYFGGTESFSIDPRVSALYRLPHDLSVKGGVAVVHQDPTFLEIDPAFGNPALGLQRALQYSIGMEWKPNEVVRADLTFFYKDLANLVSPTAAVVERDGMTVPAVYDNGGSGKVYGAELFVEHSFSNNFHGWLSYTLSRAERTDSGELEARLFDYDQPHILAVVGSYLLPRNWEVGLRFRLVSGSPLTPVVGAVYDNELDGYQPIYGDLNSGRLPVFHQLDLRIDKTIVFDTWKLSGYLSLINSTNHENVESLSYNFDYSQQGSVNGLPILPVLGVKGEW